MVLLSGRMDEKLGQCNNIAGVSHVHLRMLNTSKYAVLATPFSTISARICLSELIQVADARQSLV